jgi:predicted metal-dependent peptidase
VVLAIDTSGSVGAKELGVFASEANAVLEAFDCSVTVLYHDTEVQKVSTWKSSDGPLTLDPVGGGGTSHLCVFDWLIASGLDAACVVCLTDLDTTFPATMPTTPTLWAVVGSSRTEPPFGTRVAIGG